MAIIGTRPLQESSKPDSRVGKTLSKTADAFTTNKDLQKHTGIALAGACPLRRQGPHKPLRRLPMQSTDKFAAGSKAVADFANGYLDEGPPPASWFGYAGGALGIYLRSKLAMY